MQPSDEALLVQRARTDPDALAELYRCYLPRVYRYAFLRVGSQPDAEDITAQVFLELLDALRNGRYQERGYFRAWLFTIVRRRVTDHLRRQTTVRLDESSLASLEPPEQTQDRDALQRLARLLLQLEPEKQELMRLRFAAELGFREIARMQGHSEASVKMAVYRSLQWLRERWEEHNG